ncbi:MAG TPA: hypothetical protein PLM89_01100, partial [Anaerolineales bacterium]|nr:hypothetical protein [Anaerolineales bacterium]
ILAFLFAFDPGLVALSRQANGTMLAVTFLLFAWGMWNHKRLIPAGVFAGLALLSGPSLWAGLLTLGLTYLFICGMKPNAAKAQPSLENLEAPIVNPKSSISQLSITNPQLLISIIVAFLLGGTLFFTVPSGLSAALSSLVAYLNGWVAPTTASPGRILFTFFVYESLGVFLAALAIFRALRTNGKRAKRLTIWLGVALLLAAFYRQPAELAWAIVPLLTLSAFELARLFEIQRGEYKEVGIVAVALSILLVYTWFSVSGIALNPYSQFPVALPFFGEVQNARMLALLGSLAIVIACVALAALGWSARIARIGATFAFTVFLGIYAMAAAWGASGLRNPNGVELWSVDPRAIQADLLLASVNDLSEFSLGHPQSQPVIISGVASSALEWVLRNHSVQTAAVLDAQAELPIVITPPMDSLGLTFAYRGQDFLWRGQPQWANLKAQDWLKWLIFRELPMEHETIILWARDNLFPDARGGK